LRGTWILVLLAAASLPVAGIAHASRDLIVRPLVHGAPGARPSRVGPARGIEAEAARILELKHARWKSIADAWSAPRVDRSRFASRRVGFSPPLGARPTARLEHAFDAGTPQFSAAVDTIRVAFIRIDFLHDRGGDESSGDGRFNLNPADSASQPVDRPPHNRRFYQSHLESLHRFYDVMSYGRVRIEGEVWPRTPNDAYSLSDMADLGPWAFGQSIAGAAKDMFREMCFAADSQSTKVFHDRIPWNNIDRVVFIHAGSDLQSDIRQDSKEDIPSFTLFLDDSNAVVFPDSVNRNRPIDRAAFIPETENQDGYYGALNGVIEHESGHLCFGFFDVYNTETSIPTVGFWSLMDYGNGVGAIVKQADGTEIFATGLLAPSVDPWHRFRLLLQDQVPFPEVAYGDTVPMLFRSSERHPDVRRVSLSSDEYLMLENRHITPLDTLRFDQDDSSRVVLGPKVPDRFEVDALLPGTGVLVWHIDESVIPLEAAFPVDSTMRANPDLQLNTDPVRKAISIIEADALEDLGDLGSPYLLGAPSDPWFKTVNTTLSDSTAPNLIPHTGTRPHTRLDFLDDPDTTRWTPVRNWIADSMHVNAARIWSLPHWPVSANFPPDGPILLAVDADGDRDLEVCWAGGSDSLFNGSIRVPNPDSAALFAVRVNGQGLNGTSLAFAHLDRRPRPIMAAIARGDLAGDPGRGPALFAVTTVASGSDTSSPGGRVWLIDQTGQTVAGWPARLPSIVTTPPLIVASPPTIYVGCADGKVYGLGLDGAIVSHSAIALNGGVSGRLAVYASPTIVLPSGTAGVFDQVIAAGGANGQVIALGHPAGAAPQVGGVVLDALNGWPQPVGSAGFVPDFLWINFGVNGTDCFTGALSLVIHDADHLWGYCASGAALAGWSGSAGDTLVASLGAGDPDGDGLPEVLTQTIHSRLAFWNLTGHPSPGWPRRGTDEDFRTQSPPLAADVDGDGKSEVTALNASGIIAALRADGKTPTGWPLATGVGATGAPVIADLDRNGSLEIVAPDRFGILYGYSLPVSGSALTVTSWNLLGGDAGRTSALVLSPGATPPASTPGPLVRGSLKVYPNPARRRPVSIAYQLTEPADVQFRILDSSGHEVTTFTRRGHQSENVEIWDPNPLPPGLYLARISFRSANREQTEVMSIGVLR
jgi:M6 family metalloprotease-like protein